MINFGYGVYLDTLKYENKDLLLKWRNTPDIYRWCRQSDLVQINSHDKWFVNQANDNSVKMYGIIYPALEGEVVGVCGLTSIDSHNRRAEFSLYISPEKQGQGLAKKALKTLFHHGFTNLGLKSIWGETFDDNHAAKLFDNLEMKVDGRRRQFYFKNGRFCDAILYSMLDLEFMEAKWNLLPKA